MEEERSKHKKALETELKKLQGQITEICTFFDEQLARLFTKKIAADQAIFEEELKIIKLSALLDAEVSVLQRLNYSCH